MESENPKLKALKEQLNLELQKENSDNNLILSLSHEIASLDEKSVRFSVDAGIINRLGKELVGRQETAVSELVKNAYDADATEVDLVFSDAYSKGGSLVISDSGAGMNREELVNGFMRLSSSKKIHEPLSILYKRRRAGRKGIGRFATQRLGNKLTIVTQKAESEKALKVTINWDNFEMDTDLNLITNSIEEVDKSKPFGTDLIIENLNEGWSDSMIKRVYKYTSDLLQPFPLSKIRKNRENQRVDPGFKCSFYRQNGIDKIPIVDEQEAFFNHALAIIEGYVLDDGQGCWSLESKKLDFPQEVFLIGKNKDDNNSKFEHIKGIHFKCHYFLYDSSLIPKQSLRFIREVANEQGGIRLYRNGFRVSPYGEKLNDWLGLDDSTARRVILSSHRNINFFGFVEINDDSGIQFEETSSREGLFENESYKELVVFVQRSIINAVLKIAHLRERKAVTGQKNWVKDIDSSDKVDAAIATLKDLVIDTSVGQDQIIIETGKSSTSASTSNKILEAIEEITEAREIEKIRTQKLIDEINMLRVLAGLGLVIGEFVHEIQRFLPGFDADLNYLKKVLENYTEDMSRIEQLETNIKGFTSYTNYFDRAFSRNVLRELTPIDLRDAVNDFIEVIQRDVRRSKLTMVKPVFNGFLLMTVPMHPSEWASILFNLYTNSKKAIRKNNVDGEISIECGREAKNVYLEFSDNGIGIPKQHEDDIFTPFFTTSSVADHNSSESEVLTGTGLGLKIVKDIVESYDGEIYVTSPKEGYSTTFRIEIPIKD